MDIKVYDVILVNAREVSSYINTIEGSPAISTIYRLLNESGFHNLVVFPNEERDTDILHYKQNITNFFKQNQAPIVAISCWTSGYRIATDIASIARSIMPGAIIIGGGPHFFSSEEAEVAIKNHEFDIIFRGGATSFVAFVKHYYNGKININKNKTLNIFSNNILDKGIAYIDNENNIQISAFDDLLVPVSPILEVNDKFVDIRIIANDTCPNGCDYCVITHFVNKNKAMDKLLEFSKQCSIYIEREIKLPIRFALADSAPFVKGDKLSELLDKFRHISPNSSFALFADPQDIDEKMFSIIHKYNVTSLFFGRDRVTEDKVLGRKFRGKIRSQDILDKEYDKFLALFNFLEDNNIYCEIYIGYILSPYEDASSSKRMMDEIKAFASYKSRSGKVYVQTNLFVLNPYPATKVAERLKGDFIPMRNFYHPYPNVWISDNTNQIQIEITRFILSKLLCIDNAKPLYTPFIDFAHRLQFEAVADISLADLVEDEHLRALTTYVMKRIAELDFHDKTYNHLIELHLLGCLISVMVNRPEWLKKRLFKEVIEKIKENDGMLPLLIKDIETLKAFRQNPSIYI